MMSHEDQLSKPPYHNWVKAGLGLKYLKEGLVTFVDSEVKSLQKDFLSDICRTNKLTEAKCTKCTTSNLLPCPTKGMCIKRSGTCRFHDSVDKSNRPCPSNICDKLIKKIKDLHRYNDPSWGNTDASKWCINHWQIAKCFLPVGGYENRMSANDTDCSGILHVLLNSLAIQNNLDVYMDPKINLVSKLVQTRNDVLHSATQELEDDQIKGYVDDMIALLQDKKKLLNDPDAQKAVVKMKQLKDETFIISSKDEFDIRNAAAALNAIEKKEIEAIGAIEAKQIEVLNELKSQHDKEKNTQKVLESQQGQLDETRKQSATMKETVQKLSESQMDVESRQTSLETRQGTAEARYEITETRQDVVETKQDAVETRHDAFENKQKVVETRQDAVETRQDTVETRQDAFENKQEAVETRQDEVETRQKAVKAQQYAVETRQYAVENKQKIVETRQDAVETRQYEDEIRQTTVEAQQYVVETRQDAVETRQETVETRQKAVETQQYAVETRQDAVEIRQTNVEVTLNELSNTQRQNTAELKQKVNDLKPEILTLKRKLKDKVNIEDLHKQCLKRKQDLQECLCGDYENHLSNIPVSPVLDEIDARVEDVFVELVICDDFIHEPKTLENRTETGKKVEGYKDILYKNGKTCKNIYVIGDAGMGKTTWCMKMLSTWVSAYKKKTGQITNTSNLTADEKIMSEFDVVLFSSLRHAASDANILDMVGHQLFEEHPEMKDLAVEALKKEPHKCLIILDGLDEWSPPANQQSSLLHSPDLPGRNGLHGCTVLTTTRPWKLDTIRLKTKEIDRAVKIMGIADQDLLAEIVVDVLNEHHEKEMGEGVEKKTLLDFKSNVQETFHHESPSFMKVPLMLVFMVCIWFDDGKLETTFAANFSRFIQFLIKKAEGDTKSNKKCRLSDMTNLKTLKSKWSKSADYLPKCLHIHKHVKEYSKLLLKLSNLAFDSLFEARKENSLVFTAALLESRFTDEELDVAVKIGILSQSKAIGSKSLSCMTSLSFLHKTLQEYMAALHLVCLGEKESRDAMEKFKQFCPRHIGEVENVLLFVCGMKAQTASEISHIVAAINKWDDKSWPDWTDRGWLFHGTKMLKFVQEAHETHGFKQMTKYPIYAYFLYIKLGSDDRFMYQMILLKTKQLTHLYIDFRENFVKLDGGSCISEEYKRQNFQLSEQLPHIESLTHLTLNDIQTTHETVCWLPNLLCQMSQLRRLEMRAIFNTSRQSSPVMRIDMTNCQNLEELKFETVSACEVKVSSTNLHSLFLHYVSSCTVSACPNKHSHSPISSSAIKNDVIQKTATCTETQHSNVTLALSPGQINDVELTNCESCVFLINDNIEQGIKHMSTVQTIHLWQLTKCKVEISMNNNPTSLTLEDCSECSVEISMNNSPTSLTLGYCSDCSLIIRCPYSAQGIKTSEEHMSLLQTIHLWQLAKCKVEISMSNNPTSLTLKGCSECSVEISMNNSPTSLTLGYCSECSLIIRCPYSAQGIKTSEEHMSLLQTIHLWQLTKCKVEISMNNSPTSLTLGYCSECSLIMRCQYPEQGMKSSEKHISLLQNIHADQLTKCKVEICTNNSPTKLTLEDCSECSLSFQCQYLQHLLLRYLDVMSDEIKELLPSLNLANKLQVVECELVSRYIIREVCSYYQPIDAANCSAMSTCPTQNQQQQKYLTHLKLSGLIQDAWEEFALLLPTLKNLTILELKEIGTPLPPSVILSLQHLTHLRHFTCQSSSQAVWKALGDVLPMLTQLEALELKYRNYMPPSVILSLQHLTHLRHLQCVSLSESAWNELGNALPTLTQLARLELEELKIVQITLPIQLETVKLSGVAFTNLEIINLSTLHHLKKITLLCVSLTDTEWRIFIDSVPDTRHTLEVVLERVEMKEDTINYIKSSTRFPSQVWKRCNFLQHRYAQHRYVQNRYDATLKTV